MLITIESIADPSAAPVDEEHAKNLAESIKEVGVLNPVNVLPKNAAGEYRLVAGRHRLAALRELGVRHVEATVVELDQIEAELAAIDENLRRRRLSDLEETQALARRRELYEQLHPEAKPKRGRPKKEAAAKEQPKKKPFAQATAEQTGRSRRSVERDASIGAGLDAKAAANLRAANHPICRNKSELAKLALLPGPKQRMIAGQLVTGKLQRVPEEGQRDRGAEGQRGGPKRPAARVQRRTVEAPSDPVWEDVEKLIQEWCGDDPARRSIAAARLENLAQRVRG